MKNTDLISIHDLEIDEILEILNLAEIMKANPDRYTDALAGKTLAMIFEKPSLRTRVTFEVGMTQMGGHAIYLASSDAQIGKRESIPDVARNLERWTDAIMARTFSHQTIVDLAAYAGIPVINGLSDLFHPCQALADFFTIRDIKGDLKGLKVVFVGDGNNVAHSLMHCAAKVGANITIVTPPGYEPREEVAREAREDAKKTGVEIHVTNDIREGLKKADVVYTDVWASMGQEAEREERIRKFRDYQVNSTVMDMASKSAIFMHCLPAHRGEEVTDDVADAQYSVIFQQAENRLHVQKAIMNLLMGEESFI
ncbi:MAG: ornithine carbamoyltransferase [Acidobacteriota bacterium]